MPTTIIMEKVKNNTHLLIHSSIKNVPIIETEGNRFETKQSGDVHNRIFEEAVTEFRGLRMLIW